MSLAIHFNSEPQAQGLKHTPMVLEKESPMHSATFDIILTVRTSTLP